MDAVLCYDLSCFHWALSEIQKGCTNQSGDTLILIFSDNRRMVKVYKVIPLSSARQIRPLSAKSNTSLTWITDSRGEVDSHVSNDINSRSHGNNIHSFIYHLWHLFWGFFSVPLWWRWPARPAAFCLHGNFCFLSQTHGRSKLSKYQNLALSTTQTLEI